MASSRAQLQDRYRRLRRLTLIVYECSYEYRHVLPGSDNLLVASSRAHSSTCMNSIGHNSTRHSLCDSTTMVFGPSILLSQAPAPVVQRPMGPWHLAPSRAWTGTLLALGLS